MRVGRMRNGESWSATRLGARTDADCGGDPSLGCCYAYGDVVSAIVVGSTRLTACLGNCVLPASASGLPRDARLETRTKESDMCARRRGYFVEPRHGIESSKWAIFGKQNWRCGMNRKPGYGAQLRANPEPTKGVGRLRQQDGGHGSRNPLRSV
ncbi:hypothetical protein ACHQM5_030900 [Ranunculus cassubicifolius]